MFERPLIMNKNFSLVSLIAFHQGGFLSYWFFVMVDFFQGGFLSGRQISGWLIVLWPFESRIFPSLVFIWWVFFRVAFCPGGFLSGWLFTGWRKSGWLFSGWVLSGGFYPWPVRKILNISLKKILITQK